MFAIDAGSARDVLAVVLCPASAFTGTGGEGDAEEAERLLLDVKAALIRRFQKKLRRRTRN